MARSPFQFPNLFPDLRLYQFLVDLGTDQLDADFVVEAVKVSCAQSLAGRGFPIGEAEEARILKYPILGYYHNGLYIDTEQWPSLRNRPETQRISTKIPLLSRAAQSSPTTIRSYSS
jgi:hypothetical protein